MLPQRTLLDSKRHEVLCFLGSSLPEEKKKTNQTKKPLSQNLGLGDVISTSVQSHGLDLSFFCSSVSNNIFFLPFLSL